MCCSFCGPSNEGVTLLRVGGVLTMKDLKFSVFFNKSGYGDSVVEDYIPEDGTGGGHRLHHGYAIQSKTKPDDDFPWRFNHFVVDYLGG